MEKEVLIAEYEKKHELPEEERVVEFVQAFGKYMKKITVTQEMYGRRYSEAKFEYDTDKKKKRVAVYQVVMEHNLTDQAVFSLNNISTMIEKFVNDEYKMKTVGIQVNEGPVVNLLKLRKGEDFPELICFPEKIPEELTYQELMEFQHNWMVEAVKEKEKNLISVTKELINRSDSNLAARQDGINYTKEIKKAMTSRSVIVDRKLQEYDFREVVLDNVIFIHCDLSNANFSHVNLQNTFFINCNMTNAIFYGATLNNCYKINGNFEKMKDKYEDFKL